MERDGGGGETEINRQGVDISCKRGKGEKREKHKEMEWRGGRETEINRQGVDISRKRGNGRKERETERD